MIQRILPFLNQFIPTAIAAKGLSKIDPRLSHFFSTAAASGYGTDAAIGFLRKKLGNEPSQEEQERLEQGSAQGTLRPDEAASLQRIRQSQMPINVAQKGVAALAGIGAGSLAIPGQVPTISQKNDEAPENFKGEGGTFVPPQRNRPDVTQGPGIQPLPEGQSRTYDPLEAFNKYPELAKFVQKELSAGSDIKAISTKARKTPKIGNIVKSIEQEISEPFESLLGRLIGQNRQSAQPGQPQGQSPAMTQFLAAMQQFKGILAGRKNG